MFIMYRVELKAIRERRQAGGNPPVPNVPCGVESWVSPPAVIGRLHVPNVPCGVESN
jgi:hypothetical protein